MTVETTTVQRWETVGEAAIRLRRSAYTIRRWINSGIMPPEAMHRPVPNGPWLLDPDILDEWVRSRCFTQTPGEGDAA